MMHEITRLAAYLGMKMLVNHQAKISIKVFHTCASFPVFGYS